MLWRGKCHSISRNFLLQLFVTFDDFFSCIILSAIRFDAIFLILSYYSRFRTLHSKIWSHMTIPMFTYFEGKWLYTKSPMQSSLSLANTQYVTGMSTTSYGWWTHWLFSIVNECMLLSTLVVTTVLSDSKFGPHLSTK